MNSKAQSSSAPASANPAAPSCPQIQRHSVEADAACPCVSGAEIQGQAASASTLCLWICGQDGAAGFADAGADELCAFEFIDEPAHQAHCGRGAGAADAATGAEELQGI